jgi:hypothetical protein
MKSISFASILALFLLLGFAAPKSVKAQTPGQSASGTYQFSFEDGYTKYAEFDAKTQPDNSTAGQLFYSDEAKVTYQDVDGTGDPALTGTYSGVYIKADFDGLVVVNKNQAVMSGTVKDSSIRSVIGQRVLLTVEDNGDNTKVPDHLTWGLYTPVVRGWIPTDAERRNDDGASLRWVATDAERKDDVGVAMPRNEAIGTQSFPVSAYTFDDVARGAGDIVVTP